MPLTIKATIFLSLATISLMIAGCMPLEGLNTTTRAPWEQQTSTTERPVPQIAKTSPESYGGQYDNLPEVKVAILLPLSGKQGAMGQSMLQAAQMAVFDMGYNNFKLISRDTKGTATGAANAASQAIAEGAQLILGPLFSSSVRSVKSVAQANNLNVIAFSTDTALADSSTFLMGFMPTAQVKNVTQYAIDQGYKNFALIAPRDQYGDIVSNEFQKILHSSNVSPQQSIRFMPGDPNIINQVASVKKMKPDAVFMPVGGSQTESISSALSYNYMLPSQVKRIGTGLWDDVRVAKQPNMQGAWFAGPSPNARASFERRYTETYAQKPVRLSTLAYDATALAAVLAKNGFTKSGTPSYDYNAITNPNGFSGMDGIFRFQKNGIIERNLAILELRDGRIIERKAAAPRF